MSDIDRTPVLVGVGQRTVRDEPLDALSSPLDLVERAALDAAADAGIEPGALRELDGLAVVKCFREPTRNSPQALARRLGADAAHRWLTPDGGQAPQLLVNHFCEAIARGEHDLVLLAGGEAIDNARRLIRAGSKPQWSVPSDHDPRWLYPPREMATDTEKAHGVWRPAHVYPLFENALRGRYGRGIADHQARLGELFARFTAVAARTPGAWFPLRRDAREIATASPANRYVGWPYTKLMSAMNRINQSAAVLLASVSRARDLGVDESRWVYLHGCADTNERWFVSERVDYHSSPAIEVLGERALAMAGKTIDDIAHIDLYSCFPSAVELARDALGIAPDDPRDLTVTGGLPYHGGAGNSYSMNAIATMIERLREDRGSFGLVTANGGYLTKHSAGIYSTETPSGRNEPWRREPPERYQARIDGLAAPRVETRPDGPATVETYTVAFGRSGLPEQGIVIGRLGAAGDPGAARFVASTPPDADLLAAMTAEDFLGRAGRVWRDGDLNRFAPAL